MFNKNPFGTSIVSILSLFSKLIIKKMLRFKSKKSQEEKSVLLTND
jgi:hypothetical protein